MKRHYKKVFFCFLVAGLHSFVVVADRPVPEPAFPKALVVAEADVLDNSGLLSLWGRAGISGLIIDVSSLYSSGDDLAARQEQVGDLMRPVKEAGMSHLFFKLTFPSEEGVSRTDSLDKFLREVGSWASACQAAGATGLMLQNDPTAPGYDYRWEGYDWDVCPPPCLAERARQAGRRLRRALFSAFPEADVLVPVPENGSALPLWFLWLAGLVERDGQQDAAHVHLGFRAVSEKELDAESASLFERLSALIGGDSEALCSRSVMWNGTGSHTASVLHALLCADRYVVITPIVPYDSEWVETMQRSYAYFEGYERVGYSTSGKTGLRYYALRGKDGAGVIVDGSHFDFSELASAKKGVDLATDEIFRPSDNPAFFQNSHPFFVFPLPLKDWVTPACLWFELQPGGTDSVFPISYGFANRTGFSVSGMMGVGLRCRGIVSPGIVPVQASPGERVEVQGVLSGLERDAPQLKLSVNLFSTDMKPLSRELRVALPVPVLWKAFFEGEVPGAPAILSDASGNMQLVVTTRAGEMTMLTEEGNVLWRKWFRNRFSTCPAVVHGPYGAYQIVSGDDRGWLIACDPEGRELWRSRPLQTGIVGTPLRANLHWFPGDEILVRDSQGVLVSLLSNGKVWWRYEALAPCVGALVFPISSRNRDFVALLCASTPPELRCLSNTGNELFRIKLSFEPSCAPLTLDVDGDGVAEIVLGGVNGEVEIRDALYGITKTRTTVDGRVKQIFRVCGGEGKEFVVLLTDKTAYLCNGDFVFHENTLGISPEQGVADPSGSNAYFLISGDGTLVRVTSGGMLQSLGVLPKGFTFLFMGVQDLSSSNKSLLCGYGANTISVFGSLSK